MMFNKLGHDQGRKVLIVLTYSDHVEEKEVNPSFVFPDLKDAQKKTHPTSWKDARERTTLEIICDTEGLPIYVDGHLVGYSPLKNRVDVLPGWHKVGYFPNNYTQDANALTSKEKIMNDILVMGRLDGKIALITGGASGFGAATAKIFVREGAKVVVTDKDSNGIEFAAAEIGSAATAMVHDVTVEKDWSHVVDEILTIHGRLDTLMNNAGVMGTGALQDIEHMSLDEWKFVQAVNSDGVFLGCRAVIQAMKDTGGGSIINLSSIAGLVGSAY